MAMLLAMYQKMRLIREKNEATLDLTRYTSKVKSVSKNIERVQKMYTSKIASLESQAKIMQSSAKSIFQQTCGLVMDGNFLNPTGYGAMNGFVMNRMQELVNTNSIPFGVKDGQLAPLEEGMSSYTFENSDTYAKLYELYVQGKLTTGQADPDNKDTHQIIDGNRFLNLDVAAFRQLMSAVNGEYSQRTMAMNQMNSNYEQNISIWLENAKAQLEAEQDEALEPLNYQQTMWELEKTQAEQKLELIKEELQSYRDLCKEECKEQAPKFGLG